MAAPHMQVTATMPSSLLPPPLKLSRPFSVLGISYQKEPAWVPGGCGSGRSLCRNRVVMRIGVPGPNKTSEMVRTPDGFGDISEASGRSRKAEPIVPRNGSVEFRVELSPEGLESTLNKWSKWLVAALLGFAILWKHDAEIMWIAMGSVINAQLSTKLKEIFNQERPDPALKSDPGMPSSHAQCIFYAATFVVLLLIESLGINPLTVSVGTFTLACSSYLSWLRVSQKFHSLSQVTVGAVIGSAFCTAWFWLWQALVFEAFVSFTWVKIAIALGSVAFGVSSVYIVVQNWLEDHDQLP